MQYRRSLSLFLHPRRISTKILSACSTTCNIPTRRILNRCPLKLSCAIGSPSKATRINSLFSVGITAPLPKTSRRFLTASKKFCRCWVSRARNSARSIGTATTPLTNSKPISRVWLGKKKMAE